MLTNIINLIVECLKLLIAMCGILNYKLRRSWPAILLFAAGITAILIMGVLNSSHQISAFTLLAVIIVALAIEGRNKLLFSTLTFFTICIIDELINFIISIHYRSVDDAPIAISVVNTFSLILLTAAALIVRSFFFKKRSNVQRALNNSNSLYVVLLSIGIVASLMFISYFMYSGLKNSGRSNIIAAFSAYVLGLMFIVTGVLLIYNSISKKHYKQEAKIGQQLLRSQEKYYKMLLSKENETRKFRHDISNHVICVDALLKEHKYNEAREYLSEMKSSLSELRPRYQTGNLLVNAVLNDIYERHRNVTLSWHGLLPEKIQIADTDVCVIFSNVLENAFTAADGVEGGSINVTAASAAGSLIVTVVNDMTEPPALSNGRLITKKSDKRNHGFGMMNTASRIESSGGTIEYDWDKNHFKTEIILPCSS